MDLENCKTLKDKFLSEKDNKFTDEKDLDAFNDLKESLIKCIGGMNFFTKDELIELVEKSGIDEDIRKAAEEALGRLH